MYQLARTWRIVLAATAWGLGVGCAPGMDEVTGPLSPAEAIRHFQLDPGLEIQLVACEPEVIDPVAIRFDEDGRLWVVEMRDYPHGPPEGQPPLSKIRLLTDTDGDGRYETSRVFAEGLLFPNGIQPWRGGVIVTLAGEVAYLKDTDGDGRADLHETWYRGFTVGNPQLRANHPRFGLDNRVSVANGLMGGVVENLRRPGSKPVEISGRDFRFEPHHGASEAISGNGQFGNTSDEFGRRFVCSNRQPLDHVVLDERYLARNPLAAIPAVLQPVVAAGEQSRVYPLAKAWTTSNLHAGQFTAACGIEIDRGSLLGAEYRGNSYTCEPTGSLVHREKLAPDGASFRAESATPGREFLASRDSWFRPVNLEWGPDGALYVVDMYRAVIEHPQYMPEELQNRPDLRLGDDRGRIYRIVPCGTALSVPAKLSAMTTAELVAQLQQDHSWPRETACRLLYERQDKAAIEPLVALTLGTAVPEVKVAALSALAGLQALTADFLANVLEDPDARVREYAVLLSEPFLAERADLRQKVIAQAADVDPRLRFQVALTLGEGFLDAVDALAGVALARPDDPWTQRALALARPTVASSVVRAILDQGRFEGVNADDPRMLAMQRLAEIVGAHRDPADLVRLLDSLRAETSGPAPWINACLCGLADGCARRGEPFVVLIAKLPKADVAKAFVRQAFDGAARVARDAAEPEANRQTALKLLAHARDAMATEACLAVLRSAESQRLRDQAARSLAEHPSESLPAELLGLYSEQSLSVRNAIRDSLAVRPLAARALLEAVRQHALARAELGASLETRLRQHRDESVRKLANEVLTTEPPAERKAVLADYQSSLGLTPDVLAGKALFRQHCSTCHQIGGIGVDVAPDISDSRVKTALQLLTDILNPNQAIDNNYVSYTVVMHDGNVHAGLIAAETASSITLRQPENKTLTLLRADIEAIRSSGVSLMPEGFEKHLSPQQLADLIGFVKNWRYLEQRIPGTLGAAGDP